MNNEVLNERTFIQKYLINDVQVLLENELYYMALIILSQSIEFLGSFLDKKPFRARGQSKERFNNALNVLFPVVYRKANSHHWLYNKLRNHLSHSFIPSNSIILTSKKQSPTIKHLSRTDKKTVIVVDQFHEDVIQAANKLLEMIDQGTILSKKIESSMVDFGS